VETPRQTAVKHGSISRFASYSRLCIEFFWGGGTLKESLTISYQVPRELYYTINGRSLRNICYNFCKLNIFKIYLEMLREGPN